MKSIALPDELDVDASQDIELFHYRSSNELSKQQIVLNRNTFSFLIEGTKEVYFDHASYAIENDQFLLMKSGHCLMTEKLSSENKNYTSLLLFFSNDQLRKFVRKHELSLVAQTEPQSVYAFSYDVFIQGFVNSMVTLSQLPEAQRGRLIEIKLEEILLYLLESGKTDFVASLLHQSDDHGQHFIKTIESNQLNKLTVKELAFLCNMSVSTFKRAFEKHYQETPMKWFQNKRLEHANRLLIKEHRRPTDIFLEVGYESLSSFVQAYKMKFGVTPKQHQQH